jgi:DNA replication protein DnaC
MNPELERKLRSLRLSGMAQAVPARNQEAIHHQLAYSDFLELLVEDELARRRDRLLVRRLKQAGLPEVKTLEEFDWSFNPQVPKGVILDLATTRFAREHGGVLLLGPSGTGKTHIAVAPDLSGPPRRAIPSSTARPSTWPKIWPRRKLPVAARNWCSGCARWIC